MNDLTVVYYTNNREKPAFAAAVMKTLLETIGELPLITVSQKPMNIGYNICVGDVGSSTQNTWRQFQIGAMYAETKYVCTAEADCLYPPEYFQYRPTVDNAICCALPMWVLMARKGTAKCYYPKKMGSFGASMMEREPVIAAMEEILRPLGQWGNVDENDFGFGNIFKHMERAYFKIRHPVVSIKTDDGLHRMTPKYHGKRRIVDYWGESHHLMRRYCV
jgi:hypothetical protein